MRITTLRLNGVALAMAAITITGCGGGDGGVVTPTGQSGRLVQGPVINATIFADNVSGGVRFTQDAGEVSTKTNGTSGDFTLPSVPGYNYILVSKGGIDKLTGQAAIQMIAPAGSANVTPLTTLVALDTTGSVRAKLEALMPAGVKYDVDISTTTSQAALLVAKSVETIVQAMTSAITTKAGASAISDAQISVIQAQMMQAIAIEFAKPATTVTTLSAPASLTTTLQSASTTAVANISAANTNIVVPAGTATAIAVSAVNACATALSVGASAATTAITGGETAVITTAVAQSLVAAANNTAATAATSITANPTPTTYIPPVILVVTPPVIVPTTGSTGGSGGTTF